MRKFNLRSLVIIAICTMLAIVFCSCVNSDSKKVITEARETKDYEEIGYPVKLHYVEKSGMKYMIASGHFGEAGVSISNLTLDSLQVEYYKRSLK